MAWVTIKIYQSAGAGASSERQLIRTVHVETVSGRRLTSKRAGQLLAREFPEFERARNGMFKADDGWVAKRSLRPTERCAFHFIWEHAVVVEEVKSAL